MDGMKIKKKRFGLLADGTKIHLYTISNGKMSVSVTDYGCIITSIVVPDKVQKKVDLALGFSTLDGFINDNVCFGAIVGRFANRIGGASFSIDGQKYELDKNDNGVNTLHGGFFRWDKKVWKAEPVETPYGCGICFARKSFDGEQGFPGNVEVSITYTLNSMNELTLEYEAHTDKATPINITNHAYFNLKGHDGGSIADHRLTLHCPHYLEVDDKLIPTGSLISVENTPFDFRKAKLIGADLDKVGVGYDHCFCVDAYKDDGMLRLVAELEEPASGRRMEVRSTLPGIQFYTGNYIEGIKGKNGFLYHSHDALCLETEAYPDAPNKDSFPSAIVRPNEKYHQITQYSFTF